MPEEHSARTAVFGSLVTALRSRFGSTGATADLDEVIQAERQMLAVAPHDLPNLAAMLSNLGYDLRIRFGRTGSSADLDEAVRVGREAVARSAADHPDQVMPLANLHAAVRIRFEYAGRQEDLEESIRVGRELMARTPADHPERVTRLASMVNCLEARFERNGKRADLDEAIQLGREAAASAPHEDPDGPAKQSKSREGLADPVWAPGLPGRPGGSDPSRTETVAGTPADHPDRVAMLSHLGIGLRLRLNGQVVQRTGCKAIGVGREALAGAQRQAKAPRVCCRTSGLP